MENGYSVYVYQGTNTNLKILNNTFAFGNPYCRYASIFTDALMVDLQIKNNVQHNAAGTTYLWAWDLETLSNVSVTHNISPGNILVSGANCSSAVSPLPSGVTESDNLWTTDPLLVDPASPLTGGLRLQTPRPRPSTAAPTSQRWA